MEKEAKPHCSKPHRKSGCQAKEDHHEGVQVGHRRPSCERIAQAEETPSKARVSLIGVMTVCDPIDAVLALAGLAMRLSGRAGGVGAAKKARIHGHLWRIGGLLVGAAGGSS